MGVIAIYNSYSLGKWTLQPGVRNILLHSTCQLLPCVLACLWNLNSELHHIILMTAIELPIKAVFPIQLLLLLTRQTIDFKCTEQALTDQSDLNISYQRG